MTQRHMNPTIDTASTVRSADGAAIHYLSIGSGPSVLVIPGALSTAADYADFARSLAAHFTVHIIERRGRGRSSPQGDDYSMVKEREDVLALRDKIGASFLVGHSYGGLVALEAARDNRDLTKVAVYEPGVSIDRSIPMDWMPGYEKKLAEKKYLDAFVEFARGTGPDRARTTPRWLMKLLLPLFLRSHERRQMLGLLPENLREHREVARLDSSYENYREIPANVLLMYGGKTGSRWVDTAMEQLAAVLPHSETKDFPTLDHFGIDKKAPREVAAVVSEYFLKGSRKPRRCYALLAKARRSMRKTKATKWRAVNVFDNRSYRSQGETVLPQVHNPPPARRAPALSHTTQRAPGRGRGAYHAPSQRGHGVDHRPRHFARVTPSPVGKGPGVRASPAV